ncbi:unnamed protein product [Brassica napus]|uniref:(rape) hypothetical protein n=1 Tax=Brassica napus TaxID=3708 RepID=A0A816QN02_BRANA|nr:unnamed protein product [Brassica napus]
MIYLKRRLLIKRHKRRFFLDTRHLMEEREEKPRAGHRLPMMRNRNGRLLMAMVHVSPMTAIPVYEEIERLGSWLRRRDRTFIKSYNGDSLVGKKYECLSLLIYSTELPLSHNGENLVVAVDDDGLFTERITHFSAVSSEHQICMARRISKDHMELVVSFFCVVRRLKFVCVCPVRFVQVELLKEQLLENNKQTHWIPDYVKVSEERSMIYIYYKYSSFRE